MNLAAIYYTDCRLHPPLWHRCIDVLERALCCARLDGHTVQMLAVGSRPMPEVPEWWTQLEAHGQHGEHDCNVKIARGLAEADYDTVYLLEHDVLYPEGYFGGPVRTDRFDYCESVYRQNQHGFFPNHISKYLTSTCVSSRDLFAECYQWRIRLMESGGRITWSEPGRMGETAPVDTWTCERAVIDIRHGGNLTGMRDARHYLSYLPYWGDHEKLWRSYGMEEHE